MPKIDLLEHVLGSKIIFRSRSRNPPPPLLRTNWNTINLFCKWIPHKDNNPSVFPPPESIIEIRLVIFVNNREFVTEWLSLLHMETVLNYCLRPLRSKV